MRSIILAFILLFQMVNLALAADIYLDNTVNQSTAYDPATRSVGNGSETVYTTLSAASNALRSGDTLYIRQGEYWENITGTSGYNWTYGALSIDVDNTVITNYNGEVVWIKGGSSKTSVVNHPNNAMTLSGSGNRIQGINHNFFVYGCIIFSGTDNVLDGLDISGGWDHQSNIGGDAWYDVIRFRDSVNGIVRNCKIHDNFNHGTSTAGANKALLMHERDVNTLIENCEFYNPVAGYAYVKYQSSSGTVHVTFRKNWFNASSNDSGISGPNHNQSKQIIVYQNVFTNGGADFYKDSLYNRNFIIYNNVFYNVPHGLWSWSTAGCDAHQFFNNIFYVNSGTRFGIDFREVPGSLSGGYYDYNRYFATGSGSIQFGHNYSNYSSLNSWSSHLGSGDGTEDFSDTSNPNFLPDDGTLDGSQPSDFKRASYPTNEGRGGHWPSTLGAYIRGDEVIGTYGSSSQSASNPNPTPSPTLQPPTTPGNPRVNQN